MFSTLQAFLDKFRPDAVGQDLDQFRQSEQALMAQIYTTSQQPFAANPPFSGTNADALRNWSTADAQLANFYLGMSATTAAAENSAPTTDLAYGTKTGVLGVVDQLLSSLYSQITSRTNQLNAAVAAHQYPGHGLFVTDNQADTILYVCLHNISPYSNGSDVVNVVEGIFQQGGGGVNVAAASDVIDDPTNGYYPIPPNAPPGDFAIFLNEACHAMITDTVAWADDLRSYYHSWINDMDRLMVDLAQHDTNNAATPNTGLAQSWYRSSADLAHQDIIAQSGTGKPIGVTTGDYKGQVAIVVTLAGTEPLQFFQGNNANGALSQYIFHNSQYESDTKKAIAQYLAEHNLPPDTPIILSGHSQGGMVAQDLASASDAKTFNVQEVITYGAPDQKNNPHGVREFKYYNDGDVIPFATQQMVEHDPPAWQLWWGKKTYTVESPRLPPWTSYTELRQHGFSDQQIQKYAGDEIHVDGGDANNFYDNHGAYGNSKILQQTSLDFTITGPTEFYSTP